MQTLFGALAVAEEQQPYLQPSVVQRGTRGLAEHHLGDYGWAWNRCVPGGAPSSLLPTLDSLLLLPLSRSLIIITSPPKEGEKLKELCFS